MIHLLTKPSRSSYFNVSSLCFTPELAVTVYVWSHHRKVQSNNSFCKTAGCLPTIAQHSVYLIWISCIVGPTSAWHQHNPSNLSAGCHAGSQLLACCSNPAAAFSARLAVPCASTPQHLARLKLRLLMKAMNMLTPSVCSVTHCQFYVKLCFRVVCPQQLIPFLTL